MNILFISNFYPPNSIGGMENRCAEVVDGLRERGHEVAVLTSTYGTNHAKADNGVFRLLHLESDLNYYQPAHFFFSRRRQEQQNISYLKQLLSDFKPDIVFVWGMWNLSRLIADYLERMWSGTIVYSLANDWPAQTNMHMTYWTQNPHHLIMRPLKNLLGRVAVRTMQKEQGDIALQFENVICVSHALRKNLLQAGVPLKNTKVVYPGINLEQFKSGSRPDNGPAQPFLMLYAGSLVPHKGVHTAIKAVKQLVQNQHNPKLTIIGSGHPGYEKSLHQLVIDNNLNEHVEFIAQVPRSKMPELLRQFNVLLFPSIWAEPFSRVVLEAMASGLAVIGTTTGGSGEILVEGETALTFEPDDASQLAKQIERLKDDPQLLSKLTQNARSLVVRQFDIRRMIDEIESYLEEVAGPNKAAK